MIAFAAISSWQEEKKEVHKKFLPEKLNYQRKSEIMELTQLYGILSSYSAFILTQKNEEANLVAMEEQTELVQQILNLNISLSSENPIELESLINEKKLEDEKLDHEREEMLKVVKFLWNFHLFAGTEGWKHWWH